MAGCSLYGIQCATLWSTFLQATPAIAIVAAIFTTRIQLQRQAFASRLIIAKNHYRDTLDLFLRNTDIIFLGTKSDSYKELTESPELFKRYRWLFTITLFSLQEVYFVYVNVKSPDKYWSRTVIIIASVFRLHFQSQEFFPDYIRSGYDVGFLAFVDEGIRDAEHPAVKAGLAEFSQELSITVSKDDVAENTSKKR
jgi:hypothetical protein